MAIIRQSLTKDIRTIEANSAEGHLPKIVLIFTQGSSTPAPVKATALNCNKSMRIIWHPFSLLTIHSLRDLEIFIYAWSVHCQILRSSIGTGTFYHHDYRRDPPPPPRRRRRLASRSTTWVEFNPLVQSGTTKSLFLSLRSQSSRSSVTNQM